MNVSPGNGNLRNLISRSIPDSDEDIGRILIQMLLQRHIIIGRNDRRNMCKLCLEGILSVFNNNFPCSVHRRQKQQPVEAEKEDRSSNPQHELSVFM